MARDQSISFARLTEVPLSEIVAHMSDPRMAEHMPLLTFAWDAGVAQEFVATKEACWQRDGLGHWAILLDGAYAGWGGFQMEAGEWDFGLVLRPDHFGLGLAVTSHMLAFARQDPRISHVTFLLPPSRRHLGALRRLGATYVGEVDHAGARFRKFRLDTA